MSKRIPKDIHGAWITNKQGIMLANANAEKDGENAYFEQQIVDFTIDESSHQLVIPIIKNHPLILTNEYYRCMVWLKLKEENRRISTLMDFKYSDIKSFIRPPESGLHNIIIMLLENIEQTNLNIYYKPEVT